MRRPLCLICGLFAGVLAVCFWRGPAEDTDVGVCDGERVLGEGEVYRKEWKEGEDDSGGGFAVYLKDVHVLSGFREESGDSGRSGRVWSEQFSQKNEKSKEVGNVVCYVKDLDGVSLPGMGMRVKAEGKARFFSGAGNWGEFDMGEYYRMGKLSFRLSDARIVASSGKGKALAEGLYRLRGYFSGVLGEVFPEKEASVLRAMLLGEKEGLDGEVEKLYRDSSIIHILSISGLHISIIGMGLYRLFGRIGIPKKAGALCCIGLIWCYGLMTGMGLSSVRAILMFVLRLSAELLGRTYDMLTALAVAAAVLLAGQPMYVGYSGFLFSFGAVLSIGVLLPVLLRGKRGKTGGRLWRLEQAVCCNGAVTLGTLPIHLMFSYRFPVYSFLLNLAVIPLMTVVMADGLFCMLMGGFFPGIASVAGCVDRVLLWFFEKCCMVGSRIPYGVLQSGRPEPWQAAAYAALLVVLTALVYGRGKKLPGFWKCQWILGALCLLFLRTESGLQVTVLDVGQGDCIYIRSGEGRHYLIDGGSSSKSGVAQYQMLPYLAYEGAGHLDAVFVTHSDGDHCNGILEWLGAYPAEGITIGSLILPDIDAKSRDGEYEELVRLAGEKGITVRYMSRGQYVEDGGMRLTCLHPVQGYGTKEANEYSLALLMDYGNFSALFTGDLEGRGEDETWEYLRNDREGHGGNGETRLTLLKVAHHGSAYSTKEEMLSSLRPRFALISCGKGNRYGHPHGELLERLETAGCRIYTTADCGAVKVRTDGKRVWVESFK